MSLEHALKFAPTFVLAFFRIAGVMVSAPLFGSARVPRRLKVLFALVIAAAIAPTLKPFILPESAWKLAAGIGGIPPRHFPDVMEIFPAPTALAKSSVLRISRVRSARIGDKLGGISTTMLSCLVVSFFSQSRIISRRNSARSS